MPWVGSPPRHSEDKGDLPNLVLEHRPLDVSVKTQLRVPSQLLGSPAVQFCFPSSRLLRALLMDTSPLNCHFLLHQLFDQLSFGFSRNREGEVAQNASADSAVWALAPHTWETLPHPRKGREARGCHSLRATEAPAGTQQLP